MHIAARILPGFFIADLSRAQPHTTPVVVQLPRGIAPLVIELPELLIQVPDFFFKLVFVFVVHGGLPSLVTD
jgi:hypothetical protein